MAGFAFAVLPQEMQFNVIGAKHLGNALSATQVLTMIPPRAHHELRLERRTKDGGVVAAADRVLY